ncbi:hypothetical protein ACLQ3C_05340 [Gordonia sp. DT30]|uniref:hypothetical protein n=1 Tax=unclassified Gordonia (in: high G+C Gram-positive bacteria) TaxID=2657482 RepID=UPI003CFA0468
MSHNVLHSPVLWVILGCEIGFWALVIGGLSVRYMLRRRRPSTVILALVPVVDVVLLIAVAVDLSHGAEVTIVHRLAGIYLGETAAFGHSIVAWTDARFAHWFAGAKAPPRPPRSGPAAFRHELLAFGQWLIAAAIATGAILVLSVTVASAQQADDLRGIFPMLGVVTVIWLLTGPVWTLFDARDDADARHR